MDLALSEDGFVSSPTRMTAESLRVFSSGFHVRISGLQIVGYLQLEADGFSVARQPLLGHLEVGQGNQDQDRDNYKVKVNLRVVNGACVLKISSKFS